MALRRRDRAALIAGLAVASSLAAPGFGQDRPPPVAVRVIEPGCYGAMSIAWTAGTVREGPSFLHAEAEPPERGAIVAVCERRGFWRGIVFGDERPLDCGLEGGPPGRAYAGPCRSAWVPAAALMLFAG